MKIEGDYLQSAQHGGVHSQANLQSGKPNSFSRGAVAALLCLVGEDYTPTLQDLTWC